MVLRCKPKQTLSEIFKNFFLIRNVINDVTNPKMITQKVNHNKQRKSIELKINVFIYWYSQRFYLQIFGIVFICFFDMWNIIPWWYANYTVFLIVRNVFFELLNVFGTLGFFNYLYFLLYVFCHSRIWFNSPFPLCIWPFRSFASCLKNK